MRHPRPFGVASIRQTAGMDFVTIRDVELVSVGMEWPSANGPITFRFEHLADAMTAANEDPHVVPPRLKLGHTDPRFADPNDPGHDPYYDGEPAFGSVTNLRLVNDGATLIGDYTNVPAWLGEVMASAYPSRSIEGGWSEGEGPLGEPVGTWEVDTPGGKHYSFVLTACALLGLSRPAVQDLEDLRLLLTEGDGVIVTGDPEAGGAPAAASMGDVPQGPKLSAEVDKVVEVFCEDYCVGDRIWWWPRTMYVDPNVIIADDDEGGLQSIPVYTDEDQNVTFGEPTRVLQTFVTAPEPTPAAAVAAAASMAGVKAPSKPVLRFASREDSPARSRKTAAAQGGANAPGRTFDMDPKALAAALSALPNDATDEQIKSVMAEHGATLSETPEGDEGTDGGEGDGDEGEGAPADPPADGDGESGDEGEGDEGASASVASPTVTVDRKVFERLQADAKLGVKAHERQADEDRKALLSSAVKTGRIMPSSKAAWEKKLRATPEAAAAELDALPTGLVPVDEEGISDGGESAGAEASAEVTQSDMVRLFGASTVGANR